MTSPQSVAMITAKSRYSSSPRVGIATVVTNRHLIEQLVKRGLLAAYSGTHLGVLWSCFRPLLLLAVYTLVFGSIFKSRFFADKPTGTMDFALVLLLGLSVFGIFSDAVSRAPGIVVSNPSFVKKVVFPIDVLVLTETLVVLVNTAMSFVIFLLGYTLHFGFFPIYSLAVPFVVAPLWLITLGLCFFLAALAVYIRDIGQMIGVLVTGLLLLSPIFFSLGAAPQVVREVLGWSPITFALEAARGLVFEQRFPSLVALALQYLLGLLVLWLGWAWFQFVRKGFADVL